MYSLPHVESPEEDEYDGQEQGGDHDPGPHSEYNRHHSGDIEEDLEIKSID